MSSAPKAIAFDVNGTLLDVRVLAPLIRKIFGAQYSVEEYFHQIIQYAMATSLAGDYRDFSDIALSVLEMAASARAIAVSPRQQQQIRQALRELPPYPDVKRSLQRLRDAGFTLIALSNSGSAALDEQLRHAGISRYFQHHLSVELVQRFKPAPDPYQLAARTAAIAPQELLMVAAHAWDLLGASRAGCRTAFIRRPGKSLFPGAPTPDYATADLAQLADRLAGKRSSFLTIAACCALGLGVAALSLQPRRER